MSTTVDSRVVEMRFDNKDFEKNVASTQKSLLSLEKSLKLTESFQGLKGLDSSVKNVDFSALSNNVQSISDRFSTLGIVGMQVIMRLTNAAIDAGKKLSSMVISPILTGGWSRAMNIETAKFQLEGLGVAWKDIEDDINYGVQDTAYGLDAAAKVASQLVASNIEVGDSMKTALRAVSGVAAMTSSEYENIGDVFTKVAGQGRVMGDDLLRLSARGLNAAATIAKHLGKSEAAVREMVSNGEIDFMTFATAMDEAFGQHAKDANKTFTGAMSNIRAAMSRIGADFATPFIRNSIGVLNEIRTGINGIREVTKPVAAEFATAYEKFARFLRVVISGKNVTEGLKANVQGLVNIVKAIISVLKPFKQALDDVFRSGGNSRIAKFFNEINQSFAQFTEKLILTSDTAQKFRSVFRGLLAFVDILRQGFSTLLKAMSPGIDIIKSLAGRALDLAAALGEYVVAVDNAIRRNQTFVSIFTPVRKVFEFLKAGVNGILGFIKELAPIIGQALSNLGGAIKNSLNGFHMMDIVRTLSITTIANAITGFLISLSTAVQDIKKSAKGIINSFKTIFINVNTYLRDLQAQVKAGVIMDIAKALAVMAAALLLISMIDPERLGNALFMITTLLGEMYVMIRALNKLKLAEDVGKFSLVLQKIKFAQLSAQIIALGASLLLFATSAKILSTIKSTDLIAPLAAIGVFLLFLYEFFKKMTAIEGKIPKIGLSIMTLSIGLIAFSVAMKILSMIEFDYIISSLGAIAGLIAAFAIATQYLVGSSGTMLALSGSIAILSVGLIAFAAALKILSTIDFNDIISSLGAIAGYIGVFVVLSTYAQGLAGPMLALSGSLTILSIGLIAFAAALKILSTIPFSEMGWGLTAITGYMVSFAVIAKTMSEAIPAMLAFSSSLTILSAGLLVLATAVKIMSTIKWEKLIVSLGAFIVLMKSFSVIANSSLSSAKLFAFSGAMILMSSALLIFAAALRVLGDVDIESVIIGLIAFSAAVLTCTVLGAVLQPFIPIILEFAAAIALLGVGIGLISWGLEGFGNLLGALGKGLGGLFSGIRSAFGLMDGSAEQIGEDLDSEIASGIKKNEDEPISAAEALQDKIEADKHWDTPPIDTTATIESLETIDYSIGNTQEEIAALQESAQEAATSMTEFQETVAPEVFERESAAVANLNSEAYKLRRDALYLKDFNAEYELAKRAGDFLELNPKEWNELHGSVRKGTVELESYAEGLQTVQKYTNVSASEFRTYADVLDAVAEADKEMQDRMGPDYEKFVKEHGELTAKMVTGLSEYELQAIQTADSLREMEERLGPNEFAVRMEQQEAEARALSQAYSELEDRLGPNGMQEYLRGAAESNGAFAQSLLTAKERLEQLGWTSDQIEQTFSSLHDTIKNQISVFDEFQKGTEISKEQILSNMQSQIDGINGWADNLSTLSQKLAEYDLSSGIYEQLAAMGPQGAAYVEAFAGMTEEQLRTAAAMFEEIQLLPDDITEQVMSGFATIGEGATEGFTGTLDSQEAFDSAQEFGEKAIEGGEDGAGTHSPSWKTKEIARNCVLGFQQGLQQYRGLAINAAKQLASSIILAISNELTVSKFQEYGKYVGQGLANGMASMQNQVAAAAKNLGDTAAKGTQNALKVNSPSKVAIWIGEMFGAGLVSSLNAYEKEVFDASSNLGDSVSSGLNNSMDYIYRVFSNDFDLNPVITPQLDLSNVIDGANAINGMFESRRLGVFGDLSSDDNVKTKSSQPIQYIQNNYSPKYLSRLDIYRQTRNQLSMYKGAMA